jgi:hypothetical protein
MVPTIAIEGRQEKQNTLLAEVLEKVWDSETRHQQGELR